MDILASMLVSSQTMSMLYSPNTNNHKVFLSQLTLSMLTLVSLMLLRSSSRERSFMTASVLRAAFLSSSSNSS